MSRRILRVVLAGIVCLAAGLQYREVRRLLHQEQSGTLKEGQDAPDLVAPGPDGATIRLSELNDRVVVVSFWASWCLPCRVEMPELADLAHAWNADRNRTKDLVYLAVNYKEKPDEIRRVVSDPRFRDVRFVLDPDGKLAEAWKVSAFPTTFVLDPDRKIASVFVGYQDFMGYRLQAMRRTYQKAPPGA